MEILKTVITVLFVIAALAIIVVVLMQEGKSAGLGSLSGTNNDSYWEKNKKNSLEGKFERWTKITAGLFVVFALVLMLLQSNPAKGNLTSGAENATTGSDITVDTTNPEATGESQAGTENEVGQDQAATENQAVQDQGSTQDQAADETTANSVDTTESAN